MQHPGIPRRRKPRECRSISRTPAHGTARMMRATQWRRECARAGRGGVDWFKGWHHPKGGGASRHPKITSECEHVHFERLPAPDWDGYFRVLRGSRDRPGCSKSGSKRRGSRHSRSRSAPSLLSLSRVAVPVAKAQDNTGAAAREQAGFVGVLWALSNVLDCLGSLARSAR